MIKVRIVEIFVCILASGVLAGIICAIIGASYDTPRFRSDWLLLTWLSTYAGMVTAHFGCSAVEPDR